MRGICKYFPGVRALQNVDFTLCEGEIHALMGENGAGKSTLIKVLTGVYEKDGGEIHLKGKDKPVAIHSPQDAQNLGISTVYQEVNLCPNISVAENICIGHQYLFLHKDFDLPHHGLSGTSMLNFYSRITSIGASRHLALSFRRMPDDPGHNIKVVPPLIRREVLETEPSPGNYIHGYMLNSGFADDVMRWHSAHPEVELKFFWDKWSEGPVKKVDDTLSFYLIDDREFLRQMAGCGAYASTAGFESVCEAMYLGKPILMVPSHIEQEINAFDATRNGAGISAKKFDLSALLEFSKTYQPNEKFVEWVNSAEKIILKELTENIR